MEHGQPAVFFRVSVPRREVLQPTECWSTKLSFVREPTNPRDPLCVAAWIPGSTGESGSFSAATSRPKILGHVAKEVARWLSPLLDSPLRVTRYVASLASHTLQSPRERGSGEVAYNELFCWNAIIVLNAARARWHIIALYWPAT